MQLVIDPSGGVRCLYDELIDLSALGAVSIRRASHVDADADGKWYADLSPSGGSILGPFQFRSEALDAERDWLEEHLLSSALPRPQ